MPTLGDIGFRNELHDRAFVIAGVTDATLLTDIRDSLTKAMDNGIPFEQWQREFKKTIEGRWLPTSKTGEPNTGWRARIIYHTNVRAAYGAARRKELLEMTDTHPFWKWRTGASKVHRPDHVMRDGMILSADDPWWDEHFPPDGYGCNCLVHAVSRSEMRRLGKTDEDGNPVADIPPPDGSGRPKAPPQPEPSQPVQPTEPPPAVQPVDEPAQPPQPKPEAKPLPPSPVRRTVPIQHSVPDTPTSNQGGATKDAGGQADRSAGDPRPAFSTPQEYMAWLTKDTAAMEEARKISGCEAPVHVCNLIEGRNRAVDEYNRAAREYNKTAKFPVKLRRHRYKPEKDDDVIGGLFVHEVHKIGYKGTIIINEEEIKVCMEGKIPNGIPDNGYDIIEGMPPDHYPLWTLSHEIAHAKNREDYTKRHYVMMRKVMSKLCSRATKMPFELVKPVR
ncbi:MAG: hypothetical protein LBC63_09025 [Holophagales bacterium]|jgi:hypothetical protein|nr:hypothetical protein [Holophagales bacterium]